jgi:hypothetical protein
VANKLGALPSLAGCTVTRNVVRLGETILGFDWIITFPSTMNVAPLAISGTP